MHDLSRFFILAEDPDRCEVRALGYASSELAFSLDKTTDRELLIPPFDVSSPQPWPPVSETGNLAHSAMSLWTNYHLVLARFSFLVRRLRYGANGEVRQGCRRRFECGACCMPGRIQVSERSCPGELKH